MEKRLAPKVLQKLTAVPSDKGIRPAPWSSIGLHRASLVAQMVKNLPAMWETRVRSLG